MSVGPEGMRQNGFRGRFSNDSIYLLILQISAVVAVAIIAGICIELAVASRDSIKAFGLGFLSSTEWNAVKNRFGALSLIYGTLYTSFLALVIALPISIGTAIFLSEVAPRWLRNPISFLVELLASVPSVIYGLWGVLCLSPWLEGKIEKPISSSFMGKISLFNTPPNGYDYLAASLILCIMILPFITAVSRDILLAVPRMQREASYALGATKWQTVKNVVLPYGRSGIVGAVVLGLGRALGETMAVTMVIGNSPTIHTSLFSPGQTMASAIASEFAETSSNLERSALIEVALCLLVISLVINSLARLLIRYTARRSRARLMA